MTVLAEPAVALGVDDDLARRNARILALAQALAGANNTVIVATGGIVGAMFAPDKGLATLPITMMVLGMWIGTVPVGLLSKAFGRRFALQTGSVFGVLSGFVSCYAVVHGSFLIFLAGTFCGGLYASAHLAYRFAATDTASEAFRPKAVSWVLAGGVLAAIIGPQLVIFTKDIWQPYLFAATFVAQSCAAVLAAIVLSFVRIPRLPPQQHERPARPLAQIARTPAFVVAVILGVVSYSMMNMVMTSAPLAMVGCGHSVSDASLGIQWHVLAMYAPSFVTGTLIVRFGAERVAAAGLILLFAAASVAIAGITVAHFWSALALLGVGWNFAFIGATTMIGATHLPSERNKVQSLNDFLIFGSMAVASFSSGKLLEVIGWIAVNEMLFPVVAIAGALLIWQMARTRPAAV
jgi:predicted MFS family arabinose efflux permease